MSPANSTRRSMKIRRRGRHAAPTQVEKMAGKATVAAPAVAIAGGVIIGAPTAAGAVAKTAPVKAAAVAKAAPVAHATLDAATSAARSYEVKSGDTLARIARHYYGSDSDWHYLYQQNTSVISDPNLIYPGQVFAVASGAAKTASVQYAPRHAKTNESAGTSSHGASVSSHVDASRHSGSVSGTLGCSGLERLWEEAGGSPSEAVMAASIAMAESGGNQYAVSPTNDYGYWQINATAHGSMATFNAIGNAQAAISISSNGSNWNPWTTYRTGAYSGKC
jgi:lysozyme-like protein/LysM domain-containing protein